MAERIHEIAHDIPFEQKKNGVVWRGAKSGKWTVQNKAKRSVLVDTYKTFQNKDKINVQWGATHRLSIKAQLQYKFILCVEGNDIATNLAWALLSNSIVITTILLG